MIDSSMSLQPTGTSKRTSDAVEQWGAMPALSALSNASELIHDEGENSICERNHGLLKSADALLIL